MRLAFMRNGFEFPVVAAWGEAITVENPNEPLQGHLALTGKNRLDTSEAIWNTFVSYIRNPTGAQSICSQPHCCMYCTMKTSQLSVGPSDTESKSCLEHLAVSNLHTNTMTYQQPY